MQKNRSVWNLTGWKEATWIFALSRVLILFLTYEGVSRFPPDLSAQRLDCSINHKACVLSWWHWDVVHYINIAHNGYNPSYETAFFPLWPFLIGVIGHLFGGSATADYLASLLLANLCFFFALVVLYYLISEDFEPSIARNTLFFLTFSPVALFFFAGYTESQTLLLSALVFFFLRRAVDGSPWNWWLAGLCGFLALLGHASSIILMVPFGIVFLRYAWQRWWKATEGKLRWWQIANALLPIALIPAGVLVYMAYLYATKGNALIFRDAELSEWHRYTTWRIWQGTVNTIKVIFTRTPQSSIDLMDLIFTYVPIIALILGWKRLPLHYSLFALTGIVFFLITPSGQIWPLSSGPRYELVLFPITVVFAMWSKQPRMEKILLAFSIAAFTLHVLLFITNRWAG